MDDKKNSLSERYIAFLEEFQALFIVFAVVAVLLLAVVAVAAVLWVVVACLAVGLYKLFTKIWKWATSNRRGTWMEPPATSTISQKKQSGETPGETRKETPRIGKRGWFGILLGVIGIIQLVVALVRADWENGIGRACALMFWGSVCFAWGERKYGRKTIVTPQPPEKSEGTN